MYKALDSTLDRLVALKFLPSRLTSETTEKERFYNEARAASSLNHPNITTIYEICEHDENVFLAMEYVEGETLKALASRLMLPLTQVLEVAMQIADGLAAAHDNGIVHRDIKSDNIMITPKGKAKIMDFGLAKLRGVTGLTRAGSTLGTAAYMSPEQARGEEVDHRTDIFSSGVVLYQLMTGKLPFRGEHDAALLYSVVNEQPVPMARYNDQVSPEMERIVAKALAKDRDERYQRADDMLSDLRRERKHMDLAAAGYTTTTDSTLQVLQKIIENYGSEGPFQIAEVYAFRGEADHAFEWLETAYRLRDPGVTQILGDPLLRRIQGDPRFAAFLKKLKLVE